MNKNNFNKAREHMLNKLQETAKTVGLFAETEAKLRTTVDTGHLRRSISHETDVTPEKASVFIGSNVEYDPVIELGSVAKNIPAQPHYQPAIFENVLAIQQLIAKGMKV